MTAHTHVQVGKGAFKALSAIQSLGHLGKLSLHVSADPLAASVSGEQPHGACPAVPEEPRIRATLTSSRMHAHRSTHRRVCTQIRTPLRRCSGSLARLA